MLVQARNIALRAGAKHLLREVTLSIAGGETVALVGPNGAGKSTLLRVLSGDLRPDQGEVLLKERSLARYRPKDLALHRAVLTQKITATFPFTIREVVAMGAGERHDVFAREQIDAAIAVADLTALRDRFVTTLSGGEQQRTHFARVLVQVACAEAAQGPGLLLLDEPTESLDLRHQRDLLDAARRCATRGFGVLAVLHDLNQAALFADRIVVLDHGMVAAQGAPADVITDELLQRVFRVNARVGMTPPPGMPFLLPHAISV